MTPPTQNQATRGDRPRLVNTYDQLKLAVEKGLIPESQAVAVYYSPGDKWHSYGSRVISPFFKTDPSAHWTYNGCKSFIGKRTESFAKAKQWATDTYGVQDWLPNKMRDHVPAIVQKTFPIPKENQTK